MATGGKKPNLNSDEWEWKGHHQPKQIKIDILRTRPLGLRAWGIAKFSLRIFQGAMRVEDKFN
jgi:hypothetical protein